MHTPPRLSRSLHQAQAAQAVLGAEHPLARALEREDVVRRDLLVAGALTVAGIGGVLLGVGAAVWLLGPAGLTAMALTGSAAVVRQQRRERVLDLILEGRERLPVSAVADERRRLADPAHRRMLANTLALIRKGADGHPQWLRSSTLPYSPSALRAATSQLIEIEQLLRGEAAAVRGVALVQRLLVDGGSALHRDDSQRLCEELRRVSVLLRSSGCGAIARAPARADS